MMMVILILRGCIVMGMRSFSHKLNVFSSCFLHRAYKEFIRIF